MSKEIAGYADTLRDSLKARDRLDGKLLVEDAGDFLCTACCTEKREHINRMLQERYDGFNDGAIAR